MDVSVHLEHPRAEILQLLGNPEWYPRFFRGIGACVPGPQPHTFVLRIGTSVSAVRELSIRVGAPRPDTLTVETVEGGSFVSIRLDSAPQATTQLRATFFRASQIHPALAAVPNAAVTAWTQHGLDRIGDFIAGAASSMVTNTGHLGSVQLGVARQMVSTGVVRTYRPDRGLKQLGSLAKWGFNVAGGVAAAAAKSPRAAAVVDQRVTRTFAEVHERSTRLATGLAAAGIGPDTTVGILARNHAGLVETIVACQKLGADLLLFNTGLGARQIEELVDRHEVGAMFADDEFEPAVQFLPSRTVRLSPQSHSAIPGRTTVDDLIARGAAKLERPARTGRVMILTSGTSGTPKCAQRPSPKGFGTIAAILSRMPLQMGERMLIAAPLFHSWGYAALQLSTPIRATVVLADRFDAESCLRTIAEQRCTSLIAVPVMLQRILELPPRVRNRYDTSSLRVVASSGSPMSGALVTRFLDAFGEVLYNFYGSTEVSWATIAGPADLRAAPTTAGFPPLGTRLAVCDPDGVPVPHGALGRIYVGNDMLFDGYVDADSPNVTDAMMDTGDLGYLDGEGRLFVAGRDDEMIISGGENVFPRPVEEALALLPQVSEAAVLGVPDPEFGQRLVAFVVPHHGARIDQDMISRYIRHRLSRFSVPREVTFLDALPRNATGKVLKRLLA